MDQLLDGIRARQHNSRIGSGGGGGAGHGPNGTRSNAGGVPTRRQSLREPATLAGTGWHTIGQGPQQRILSYLAPIQLWRICCVSRAFWKSCMLSLRLRPVAWFAAHTLAAAQRVTMEMVKRVVHHNTMVLELGELVVLPESFFVWLLAHAPNLQELHAHADHLTGLGFMSNHVC